MLAVGLGRGGAILGAGELLFLFDDAGRYAEAVGIARKAIRQRFELTNGHRIYVASLAQAGLLEEARAALARLQELHPENSIAWIERNVPYTPGPMARFLEGFRKAGLR